MDRRYNVKNEIKHALIILVWTWASSWFPGNVIIYCHGKRLSICSVTSDSRASCLYGEIENGIDNGMHKHVLWITVLVHGKLWKTLGS